MGLASPAALFVDRLRAPPKELFSFGTNFEHQSQTMFLFKLGWQAPADPLILESAGGYFFDVAGRPAVDPLSVDSCTFV